MRYAISVERRAKVIGLCVAVIVVLFEAAAFMARGFHLDRLITFVPLYVVVLLVFLFRHRIWQWTVVGQATVGIALILMLSGIDLLASLLLEWRAEPRAAMLLVKWSAVMVMFMSMVAVARRWSASGR